MPTTLIDTILYNGHIRTLDDAQPTVTALAISGGRIVAAGSDDAIRALAGAGTKLTRSRRALGRPRHDRCSRPLANDDARCCIRSALRPAEPMLPRWNGLARALRRHLTARGSPAMAGRRMTGTTAVSQRRRISTPSRRITRYFCNHAAATPDGLTARRCDYAASTPSTPDPDGGEIAARSVRRADRSAARMVGDGAGQAAYPADDGRVAGDADETAQEVAHSMGITGIHDFDDQECFAALQVMRERGDLGCEWSRISTRSISTRC